METPSEVRSRTAAPRRRARPGALLSGRAAQRLGVAGITATLLCGCLGDQPVDPEVQPLEIVAGNADPEIGPCLLNVDEVGAGTHEVTALSVAGGATVRIVDPSGAVVLERAIEAAASQGGGQEAPAQASTSVRLNEGEHRVECTLSDGTHSTALQVVPARPGNEHDGTG